MKRLLTFFLATAISIMALAADYTGQLTVYLGGKASDTSTNTISVDDNGDNTYNLSVKNFSFGGMSIGDINLTEIPGTEQADGSVKISGQQGIKILVVVPVTVKIDGTLSADRTKFEADLDMGTVQGQTVTATFKMPTVSSYSGYIGVSVGGVAPTEQAGTVIVTDNGDGSYVLAIENFSYGDINLGTVTLSNVKGETQADGSVKLTDEEPIKVSVLTADVKLTDALISADGKSLTITGLNIESSGLQIAVTFNMGKNSVSTVDADVKVVAIFTLTGKKVDSISGRGVYIVRYSNGTAQKRVVR